ncbi:unnamed protein product, partial [Heterotrigona itama]
MSQHRMSDVIGILRGAKIVADTMIKYQEETIKHLIRTSNLKITAEKCLTNNLKTLNNIEPNKIPVQITKDIKEVAERINVVEKGIIEFIKLRTKEVTGISLDPNKPVKSMKSKLHVYNPAKDPREVIVGMDTPNTKSDTKSDVQGKQDNLSKKYSTVKEKIETISKLEHEIPKIVLSEKDKAILKKLELEHEKNIKSQNIQQDISNTLKADSKIETEVTKNAKIASDNLQTKPKLSVRPKQTLSPNAKEQKVPSTRLQRMISFGTLGVGLGVGTFAEYTRRTFGLKKQSLGDTFDSLFLTKANAERIVSTLCKVRGAALKIGQILSIQDDTIISPELQKVFERVRQSADFMPTWQVEKVLSTELGHDWRNKLTTFEDRPFAAASIGNYHIFFFFFNQRSFILKNILHARKNIVGQVHYGTLLNGQGVAIKIQYPGVAMGIQSDVENLVGIMKVWNIFPKGMFIDNVVDVAKRELAWEVDYIREAECTRRYKQFMKSYSDYYVPAVI